MANLKMLLVEGDDDEHVVYHICRNYGIPAVLDIRNQQGVERLLANIRIGIESADDVGDAVGILVDADQSAQRRWQAVRDQLAAAGYRGLPDRPDRAGVIVDPPADTLLPRAGVWIMPDNQNTGYLENFLRFMVPAAQSALFEHAEASVAGIPPAERLFSPVDAPKALIHTWLAWQEDPGRPFGTAITAGFLNPDVSEAAAFATWLQNLFFADADDQGA